MSRLALVLDSTDEKHVRSFIDAVKGKDLVLKVGLRTLPLFPIKEWAKVADSVDLFIDAKLHDIPDQVGDAVALWSDIGAKFITLHCQGGPAMMSEAVRRAPKETKILGVTVLTSLGADDLARMGISQGLNQYVADLVRVSLESGVNSFVSSAFEVDLIRATAGTQRTYHVCPGISLGAKHGADQKRVVELSDALKKDIDLLVMGRSLTATANFMDTLEKVLETIRRESRI